MFTVKVITETDYKYTLSEMENILVKPISKTGIKNSEFHYENCKKLFCEFLKRYKDCILGSSNNYYLIYNSFGELICVRTSSTSGIVCDLSIAYILYIIAQIPDNIWDKTFEITIS